MSKENNNDPPRNFSNSNRINSMNAEQVDRIIEEMCNPILSSIEGLDGLDDLSDDQRIHELLNLALQVLRAGDPSTDCQAESQDPNQVAVEDGFTEVTNYVIEVSQSNPEENEADDCYDDDTRDTNSNNSSGKQDRVSKNNEGAP